MQPFHKNEVLIYKSNLFIKIFKTNLWENYT